MGLPRWEVAGNDLGRRIYHLTWDFQDGEVAGNELGRRIYHMRLDVQDGKWQVMRWEDEVATGEGTSKMGSGR